MSEHVEFFQNGRSAYRSIVLLSVAILTFALTPADPVESELREALDSLKQIEECRFPEHRLQVTEAVRLRRADDLADMNAKRPASGDPGNRRLFELLGEMTIPAVTRKPLPSDSLLEIRESLNTVAMFSPKLSDLPVGFKASSVNKGQRLSINVKAGERDFSIDPIRGMWRPPLPDDGESTEANPDTAVLVEELREALVHSTGRGPGFRFSGGCGSFQWMLDEAPIGIGECSTKLLLNIGFFDALQQKLSPVWSDVYDQNATSAASTVRNMISEHTPELAVFGLRLNGPNLAMFAPIASLIALLHLYAHLCQIVDRTTTTQSSVDYPWLLLYPDRLSRALAFVTLVGLPVAANSLLIQRIWNPSSWTAWIGLGATIALVTVAWRTVKFSRTLH